MGISVLNPPAVSGGKIQKKITLTSGTSWTVPTGVTDINVLLVGGGGGGAGVLQSTEARGVGFGHPGESIWSTVTTTPGASIAYAIGAGGGGGGSSTSGSAGGTTTFTGATSAVGGNGGANGVNALAASVSLVNNGGLVPHVTQSSSSRSGGTGGSGFIVIEYWV